jgi:hypothetical protein
MKYVNMVEGVAFVALSVASVKSLGFTGLLLSALVCNIAITGTYSVGRTAGYFGISRLSVTRWIARPAGIFILTAGIFAISLVPALDGLTAPLRFGIGAVAFCGAVVPALWFFGIPPGLRLDLTGLVTRILRTAKSRLRSV